MIGACDVTHTAWKLKWKNLNGLMQPLAEHDVSNNVSRTSAGANMHLKLTEKKNPSSTDSHAHKPPNVIQNDLTSNNVR